MYYVSTIGGYTTTKGTLRGKTSRSQADEVNNIKSCNSVFINWVTSVLLSSINLFKYQLGDFKGITINIFHEDPMYKT